MHMLSCCLLDPHHHQWHLIALSLYSSQQFQPKPLNPEEKMGEDRFKKKMLYLYNICICIFSPSYPGETDDQ